MPTKYHLTPDGPKLCTASVKTCKYGKSFHGSREEVEKNFEKLMIKENNPLKSIKKDQNPLSEDSIISYTEGDCFYFANELQKIDSERFSIELVSNYNDYEHDSLEDAFYHVYVYDRKSDCFIDAKGIHEDPYESMRAFLEDDGYMEDEEKDELIDSLYGAEITEDIYLEQGGHDRTYRDPIEEDSRKFYNWIKPKLDEKVSQKS